MTPEVVIARLAEILAGLKDFSNDDMHAAMSEVGVPDDMTHRAYQFMQVAWGRAMLNGLGVRFSPDYFCFRGDGEAAESGCLADEPYFAAAMRMAGRYARSPGFKFLAASSSDFHAINEALLAGSNPEDLATAPPALFLEPPTPAGFDRAMQHVKQWLPAVKAKDRAGSSAPAIGKKPWWRFW